jgi:uncharacterized YccA/Bax inhibitor family protein
MANPVFSSKTFEKVNLLTDNYAQMTIQGAVQKVALLFFLMVATAAFTWGLLWQGSALGMTFLVVGAIGGLIIALLLVFKMQWAATLAPIYALCQGAVVGSISYLYQQLYQGIVMQAVLLTFCVVLTMLALYVFRIVRVTQQLRMGIMVATGAVGLFYLVAMVLRFFNIEMPLLHSSGTYGIIFSLLVIGIAAFNLLLDFDLIEQGAQSRAPKYMEWYAAFGVLVTVIWLYLEILRLLGKLNRRD